MLVDDVVTTGGSIKDAYKRQQGGVRPVAWVPGHWTS